MKSHRLARVNSVVREVASETVLFELRDPRVKGVTITRAEVTPDLQRAKVYVSIMGTEKEQQLCLHGLRSAAGYVQSKLGDRMKTRYTPVVEFMIDAGVKNSIEVMRLLNEEAALNGEDLPHDLDQTDDESRPDPDTPPADGGRESPEV